MIQNHLNAGYQMLRREGPLATLQSGFEKSPPHPVDNWYTFIQYEIGSASYFSIPLQKRLWAYQRGFLSQSVVIYNLDSKNYTNYLSDYSRLAKTPKIGGNWRILLDNKLLTHLLFSQYDESRMEVFGIGADEALHIARAQNFLKEEPKAREYIDSLEYTVCDDVSEILRKVDEQTKIVLKPVVGGGGDDVHILSTDSKGYRINGISKDIETARYTVEYLLGGRNPCLICEFVEQGEYATEIQPTTPNTIRAITMVDEDGPFIAGVYHRFGSSDTGAIDNFSQGGLSAKIDPETGQMSSAATFSYSGNLVWHDKHPDTEARIRGSEIPGWQSIKEKLLEMSDFVSDELPYIGWDIIVTDPGEFKTIEANSYPNVRSYQLHDPLLTDVRVEEFYSKYGVI